MIEGNAAFAYRVAKRYAFLNRNWTQIDPDDLLQASFVGLIEAVDRYDPERGYVFTTYANFWIMKRIYDELYRQHWTTTKPPSKDMTHFLYGKMGKEDPDKADTYMDQYMLSWAAPEESSASEDDGYGLSELTLIAESANLTVEEMQVFKNLCNGSGDENLFERANTDEYEASMLIKLRRVLDEIDC